MGHIAHVFHQTNTRKQKKILTKRERDKNNWIVFENCYEFILNLKNKSTVQTMTNTRKKTKKLTSWIWVL